MISAIIFKNEIILKRNELLKTVNSIDSNIYFVKKKTEFLMPEAIF